jgi:hypothetical protein
MAPAALFGLGIMASRAGRLTAVPDRRRRESRTVTLAVVGAAGVFAAAAIALGVVGEQLWGGWYWPALVFAAGESTLSVFGPVWLLGVAQRRLNRSFRWAVRCCRAHSLADHLTMLHPERVALQPQSCRPFQRTRCPSQA